MLFLDRHLVEKFARLRAERVYKISFRASKTIQFIQDELGSSLRERESPTGVKMEAKVVKVR